MKPFWPDPPAELKNLPPVLVEFLRVQTLGLEDLLSTVTVPREAAGKFLNLLFGICLSKFQELHPDAPEFNPVPRPDLTLVKPPAGGHK
jgi:hypothetical protein